MHLQKSFENKAVIDRIDFTPGVAAWEVKVTLSARKVVQSARCHATGLVLLHTVYSQAQCCVCAALQPDGDVEQPWLTCKYDVIHKTRNT